MWYGFQPAHSRQAETRTTFSLKIFDSDRVDASSYVYKRMSSSGGPMMLVNYGVTALLAAAGGKRRA